MQKKIFTILLCFLAVSVISAQGLRFDPVSFKKNFSRNTFVKEFDAKTQGTKDIVGVASEWSLKRYCPTPQNQGKYQTCLAWSTVYAAGTIIKAQKKHYTGQEEIDRNALSPLFVFDKITDLVACDSGTEVITMLSEPMLDEYSKADKTYGVVPPAVIPTRQSLEVRSILFKSSTDKNSLSSISSELLTKEE